VFVDDPSDLAPAWEAVLCADRPAVLEAVTDPDVSPLPPHITLKQAKAYASALWQGDPDAAGIIRASLKELFA
jgi:pyruvate dehydrogenase (quinone)